MLIYQLSADLNSGKIHFCHTNSGRGIKRIPNFLTVDENSYAPCWSWKKTHATFFLMKGTGLTVDENSYVHFVYSVAYKGWNGQR
jgi:hypothetical protein